MTERRDDHHPDSDIAIGWLKTVMRMGLAILLVTVATCAAIMAGGSLLVIGLSIAGGWTLAKRLPRMGPPLAFVTGALAVLAAAGEFIIQMEIHHVEAVMPLSGVKVVFALVLLIALAAMLCLGRWAWRRGSALEGAESTAQEPPNGEEPPS